MSECIDRDAAIETVKFYDGVPNGIMLAIWSLTNIPAADVRPVVRGKWIVRGQDIYCSVCKNESGYNPFGASSFSSFCPNCGADMRKEERNENK